MQFIRLAIAGRDKPLEGFSNAQAEVLRRVLAEASPRSLAEGLSCLDNWAVALALKNLFRATQLDGAFRLLVAELLFLDDKSGASLLDGVNFELLTEEDGSIHVPGVGVRMTWTGGAPGPLHWRCGSRFAEVTSPSSGRSATVPLPLTATFTSEGVTITPYDRVPRVDVAVLPRPAGEACGFASLPYCAQNGVSALPLLDTVQKASLILDRIWPERLVWAASLVPAILDLGVTNDESHRLSGSFEPGIPIYLSRVSEPFRHAEDLIHEVQHLRFPLTIPASDWFGRWNELECDYTSPYRSDPRPLQGVHLGLHAFVAVTEFRLRAHNKDPDAAFSLRDLMDTHWRNLYAYETILAHDELSADGRQYYANVGHRLREQDRQIRTCLAHKRHDIWADLPDAFWAERTRHKSRNAAIKFGPQASTDLLTRCTN